MKKVFLLIAIAALFTACDQGGGAKNTGTNNSAGNTGAATAVSDADVKKFMTDFETALNKADAAALDKMYADDYMLIDQNGAVSTKAQRVEAIKSGKVKFEGLKFSDLKVKMHPAGDGAVITGKVTGKTVMDGKTEERNSMVTWVAGKGKDGTWRFLNAQITDIKEAAKADDKGKTDDKGKAEDSEKKEDDHKSADANKAANTSSSNK